MGQFKSRSNLRFLNGFLGQYGGKFTSGLLILISTIKSNRVRHKSALNVSVIPKFLDSSCSARYSGLIGFITEHNGTKNLKYN